MAPKSGVLYRKVLQKVEYLLFTYFEVAILILKRWVKKWSTFVKMAPKNGVPFQKVLQKVEHLYRIRGFRGLCSPNQMYFGMDIQNAYLAEDRAMLWALKASEKFLKTRIRR